MSIIRILPEKISNRIAAGEVIERPASVVKELVENSLDAQASEIKVIIEKAGKKLISITDNGVGMDEDDTLLCLEPHATSKIASLEDIEKISTMGFRGEAIPSIASISRFRIRTRKNDSLEGNEVIVEGGKLISSSPVGCAPGTEINIRDLFFNTPARRKFLKTDNTEEKHINDIVSLLALANCQVHFELIIDGVKTFSSPGNTDLLPRINTFFGKTMTNAMIPVNFEKGGVTVSGYISRHGFTKKSRREQRVFLNHRPIESLAVYKGIQNGYESLVMKGCYPPVILFLEMDPTRVDVNVHPAKREVRFRESGLVSGVIADAIRETLRTASAPTLSVAPELPLNSILKGASVNYSPSNMEQSSFNSFENIKPEILPQEYQNIPVTYTGPDSKQLDASFSGNQNEEYDQETKPFNLAFKLLGFLDDTYILASAETGLVIIDQHAAHERVLFERLMKRNSEKVNSQQLLIPATIDLSRSEVQFLMKNSDPFAELGFEVESFGNNTVIIHAVPASLRFDDAAELFTDLIDQLVNEENLSGNVDKSVIAQVACKKAIKAHDKLTMDEVEALIRQMGECELPYSCPHGRPTLISISYKELEKRFGRK
jgi:DNA mismatch repair protein MutL